MTDFSQQYAGYRYASTRRGDSLQRVALRELGDASEWTTLVWFNDLIPPFITDDADEAGDRVLLSGQAIKIPASTAESEPATDGASNVLLTDASLSNGRLTASSGDLVVVTGRENLKQALRNRFVTDPGELLFHADYGCKLQRRKGSKNNAVTVLRGQMDVQDACTAESRLKTIDSITVSAVGDALVVSVQVTPISGDSVTIEATT